MRSGMLKFDSEHKFRERAKMTEREFISLIIGEINGYYNDFTQYFYDKYSNYRFNLRKMNCRQATIDLDFMECLCGSSS